MIITELISDQILGITVMFGAGILIAFMYQLFLWVSGLIIRRRWMANAAEIIFWAAAAWVVSKFLYYCAYGEISVHTAGAFVAGLLLWKLCFYDIIQNICAFLGTKLKIEKDHGKEKTKQSI